MHASRTALPAAEERAGCCDHKGGSPLEGLRSPTSPRGQETASQRKWHRCFLRDRRALCAFAILQYLVYLHAIR